MTTAKCKQHEIYFNAAHKCPECIRKTIPAGITCAICGIATKLVRDHDHTISGKITAESFRGWLCTNCNVGLGMFANSPERLSRAIQYLQGL